MPFQTSVLYADASETNTGQGLTQENIGSGDSTNINCGQNSISSSVSTTCGSLPIGKPSVGEFTLTLENCRGDERNVLCDRHPPDALRTQLNCQNPGNHQDICFPIREDAPYQPVQSTPFPPLSKNW